GSETTASVLETNALEGAACSSAAHPGGTIAARGTLRHPEHEFREGLVRESPKHRHPKPVSRCWCRVREHGHVASASRRPRTDSLGAAAVASLRLSGRSTHDAATSPSNTSGTITLAAGSPTAACDTAAPVRSNIMPA